MWDIGGKAKRKKPLGRPRHAWVDNIKMDLGEIKWGGVYWLRQAQAKDSCRTHMKATMNL
jgi:hypothetical protein